MEKRNEESPKNPKDKRYYLGLQCRVRSLKQIIDFDQMLLPLNRAASKPR